MNKLARFRLKRTELNDFVILQGLGCALVLAALCLAYIMLPHYSHELNGETVNALSAIFWLLLPVVSLLAGYLLYAGKKVRRALLEARAQTRLLTNEINAHQQTLEELRSARQRADHANQAKSRYLAGISHELRNPLNVVMGYAQLLDTQNVTHHKSRHYGGIIKRNAEQLSDLIEGLLEVSKIELGHMEIFIEPFNIHRLLEQLVETFRYQAKDKGLNFHYKPSPFLPEVVRSDKKRLRQILINLLGNAIKYTHHGSVSLELIYRNQVAQFIVEDTGLGIAQTDQASIFLPFSRGSHQDTQRVGGTGLGLAISNSLAELMGGEITYSSELGQGSRFVFKVMLSNSNGDELIELAKDGRVTGYSEQTKRLLVVDDDVNQQYLFKQMLTPLGFIVETAGSEKHMLQILKGYTPDLFILDIALPEVSGWEMARGIRLQYPNTPIMMASANTREIEKENLALGLHQAYLTKPITKEVLLDNLAELLGLNWQIAHQESEQNEQPSEITIPDTLRQQLKQFAEIGYLAGSQQLLEKALAEQLISAKLAERLNQYLTHCDFEKLIKYLEQLDE